MKNVNKNENLKILLNNLQYFREIKESPRSSKIVIKYSSFNNRIIFQYLLPI